MARGEGEKVEEVEEGERVEEEEEEEGIREVFKNPSNGNFPLRGYPPPPPPLADFGWPKS